METWAQAERELAALRRARGLDAVPLDVVFPAPGRLHLVPLEDWITDTEPGPW